MKRDTPEKLATAAVFIVSLIVYVWLFWALYKAPVAFSGKARAVILIIVTLLLFCAGSAATRRCVYDEEGLSVRWFSLISRYFSWESFRTTKVCMVKRKHIAGGQWVDYPVIVFSTHRKPRWIKGGTIFEALVFSSFCFDFTPELYMDLKNVCPRLHCSISYEKVLEAYEFKRYLIMTKKQARK